MRRSSMAVAALVLLGAACSEREDPALVRDVSLDVLVVSAHPC